jgi:hypothetical protein
LAFGVCVVFSLYPLNPVVAIPSIRSRCAEIKKIKMGTSERMDIAKSCPNDEADVAS